jgi:hypothetical protein
LYFSLPPVSKLLLLILASVIGHQLYQVGVGEQIIATEVRGEMMLLIVALLKPTAIHSLSLMEEHPHGAYHQ